MQARLKLYPKWIKQKILRDSLAEREQLAQKIASTARGLAPVLTGQYRGGIDVVVEGMTVKVIDSDDDAIHKEYGTSDTPAHAALTNAAISHGKYVGMRPRR